MARVSDRPSPLLNARLTGTRETQDLGLLDLKRASSEEIAEYFIKMLEQVFAGADAAKCESDADALVRKIENRWRKNVD